ncbi:Gluconate 5-dehydrogenase [Coriobacteriaceae bacterium CHKCI002]|nr:Gluconate 5-dehydrogenase [Coriobacteriaceae bacterium CHKCI002]
MEKQRFVDKIALVTGGANGLGRGMVDQLVKEGAQVAVFDIEDGTMEEAFAHNDRVCCLHCDVRDYDQVQKGVQDVIERYGRIDVLMNNAGIIHRQGFLECSKEGWLDVMDTNLNGVFYVGQAVARTMVDLGVEGHIVNTCSNTSRKTVAGVTPYGPSKAGVKMLTQIMALELAKYGIHVNAVAPGTSRTRIAAGTINDPERSAAFLAKMPFGRYGEVREMVSVALFLASEDASFITGETIYEEGGFSLP